MNNSDKMSPVVRGGLIFFGLIAALMLMQMVKNYSGLEEYILIPIFIILIIGILIAVIPKK